MTVTLSQLQKLLALLQEVERANNAKLVKSLGARVACATKITAELARRRKAKRVA